ncbi:MAG: methyltransferase domain-containing protein [Eubacteriales bacterium]|nr:methyltransferase domain-containing protein [Eubacteriales bacterium]
MITKAQSKRYAPRPSLDQKPKLTALEKGLLRWSMAERGDKVLDVHVGNGLMLEYLNRNMECEICGMSDDMECVRLSRSRLRNADIVYASREDIPWMQNTFDSVYLKLVSSPVSKQTIGEVLRVLKPGGQMLVGIKSVPTPFRQIAGLVRIESDEEWIQPVTREQTLDMMREAGLTQITWQPTNLLNGVCIGWKPLAEETA